MAWTLKRRQDTDWQKLTPLGVASGDAWMKRTGSFVEVAFRAMVPGASGVVDLVDIPVGWRPDASTSTRLGTLSTDTGVTAMASYYAGKLRLINSPGEGAFGGRLIWSTTEQVPR